MTDLPHQDDISEATHVDGRETYHRSRKRLNSLVTNLPLDLPQVPTPDTEAMSSTTRQKWTIRNTPVVNSKYLNVWKRVHAKLKAKLFIKSLGKELQLFGASTTPGDSTNPHYQKTRINQSGTLRSTSLISSLNLRSPSPWYIFHPNHWFKSVWNVVLSILLIYTATIMPFRLAFIDEEDIGFWLWIEYVVNGLFFLDFLINCFSAYYDLDGEIIFSWRKIMVNYMKSWFIIDLVACIPFTQIDTGNSTSSSSSSGSSGYNSLIRLIRLPRLYRLFRISRLFKALKQTSDMGCMARLQDFVSLKHSAMRLISFSITVLICVHLMSCLWYFSASLTGFGPDTWVVRLHFIDSDMSTLYIASFYFAFTTLTTVGYGDISGGTSLERILCVLWMMFGVCFFSFTIGSLTSMITNIDTKENVLTQKLAIIDEFSRESKLDRDLRARLRHAIKYLSEKTGFSWSDKQNIFNELPKHLKYEVAMGMHQGAVKTIPFFEDKNEVFIASVVPFLLPMFVNTDGFVYKEKEYADEIYFLTQGRCALVYLVEGIYSTVKKIQRGSYFGEIEIIFEIPRKYTIKTVSDCDFLVMNKTLFQVVREEFAGIYQEMAEIAETRDVLNQKGIKDLQELLKMKKTQGFENLEIAEIKQLLKKKTEKFIPMRRNSARITSLRSEESKSEAQSPKSDSEMLQRSNSIKERLEEAGKKLKAVKEMLMEQNQFLRESQFSKTLSILPPLKLPISDAKKIGENQDIPLDTPSFNNP